MATTTIAEQDASEEGLAAGRRLVYLGYGACFVAGCIWGTGFYFGRLALNEMIVEYMVLYRFLFACVILLPVMLAQSRSLRFTRTEWRQMLLCAFLCTPVQFLVQFHGLALTTVSHASLMMGAMPVLLAGAAALFAGERLDWLGWTALCASTMGAALVVLGVSHGPSAHGEQPSLVGDLLVLLSIGGAMASILLSKKMMQTHSPAVVTAYTTVYGTAMLAVWVLGPWLLSPLTGARVSPPPFALVSHTAWVALALSGLFCTATTSFLWNWGIHHVPASRAGVFINIEPALGTYLGVKLLGERLGPFAGLGGGLILAAALVLTTRGQESGLAQTGTE
jgi:drug/metabolite transporter (DMT)-like permease